MKSKEILKELENIFYKRFSVDGMKQEYKESDGNPRYKYVYYDLQDDLTKLVNKIKKEQDVSRKCEDCMYCSNEKKWCGLLRRVIVWNYYCESWKSKRGGGGQ